MTGQELSEIVALVRSVPKVDAEFARPKRGPLGTVLIAMGEIRLSYDVIADHELTHAALPPAAEANAEFGAHLATVGTGRR